MTKIGRPILEYRDFVAYTGLSGDENAPPKMTMQRFVRLFREVEDVRLKAMIEYPLEEILVIAFLAVLGNASEWDEIELFGDIMQQDLKKYLKLDNGIPSPQTFRRVFALLDPEQLQKATVFFLLENMAAIRKSLGIKSSRRPLSPVGKEVRGTDLESDPGGEIPILQSLQVYDAFNGICLVANGIDSKTNELPAAQEALKLLQLKHTMVTFDALHTQSNTIAIIRERGGDFVGALPDNQENLAANAAASFPQKVKERIRKTGKNYCESVETSRSQVETRRFYMSRARLGLAEAEEWRGLRHFICFEKNLCSPLTSKETTEIRYYITNLNDVAQCANAIRDHWCVENRLYLHLDSSFDEDDNTALDRQAYTNLSNLNKMARSLYKLIQPLLKKNTSIQRIRKQFSWVFEDRLSLLLKSFDDNSLKEALENSGTKPK